MTTSNHQVIIRHRLTGVPQATDFDVTTSEPPEPADGEILVRHHYLALDPWQRSAIAGRHTGHGTPLGQGDTPPCEAVGEVIESHCPGIQAGEIVRCMGGWQEYSVTPGAAAVKVDPHAAPITTSLGVLGMPGLTAWASIVRLADVQPGQTVLVSAAHGPVGSMVGQIAMQKGATAVGIAGSDKKCAMVTGELGFAECVNYKRDDYPEALRAALPDGANIYHDNVGGQMLIDAIGVMKEYGTVVLCGLISQYNDPALAVDLPVALPIIKRLTMKGLVVYDHDDARDEFLQTVTPWVNSGAIRYLEDIADGLDATPAQFCRLMRGENAGKTLVRLVS